MCAIGRACVCGADGGAGGNAAVPGVTAAHGAHGPRPQSASHSQTGGVRMRN